VALRETDDWVGVTRAGRGPVVVRPALDALDVVAWAEAQQALVRTWLTEQGAVLLRGFDVPDVERFRALSAAVAGTPLDYRERSSPRSAVAAGVYTSTEHPAHQRIFLHNENSYQRVFPAVLAFFCVTPASRGGATPIADCRRVFDRIDPAVRERFLEHGVMYRRSFRDGLGLTWQTVFQTDRRDAVEDYCARAGIELEWTSDGLRTRQIRAAAGRHPRTRAISWFNHAAFFHVTTLEPAVRAALLAQYGEDDLPSTTLLGDGSSIESADLDVIRAAYAAETVPVTWERGDVLLVDNVLMAHGRDAFAGERHVMVTMTEPLRRASDDPRGIAELVGA
jgi:alpha-ketoglutarate-dependent taurine dioxygenase